MPEKIRGAIFDLDGTLLDSMGVWEQIDVDFLKKRGIAATEDYTRAVTTMSFQEAADYSIRRFDLRESPDEIIREWNEMCLEAYTHTILLKPGAKDYLLRLKRGKIKLGVATALSSDLYGPALKNNGIFDLFEAFASIKEVSRGKGFPDVYLLAAERLELEPYQCEVFEDILPGIRGAKAGGLKTCGVYDPSSAYEWEKICAVADRVITGF